MDVVEKIDYMRKQRGWSVNYLAMEACLTQSTVNNMFARHAEPRISTLRSICAAFEISLADFFAEENAVTTDGELFNRISALSPQTKSALLEILRNMK